MSTIKDAKINNTFTSDKPEISQWGVGMTPLKSEISKKEMFCKIAFDYLSFTFPYSIYYMEEFDEICSLLLLNENYEESPFGRNGYSLCKRWKNELDQDKETFTSFLYNGGTQTNNAYGEKTGFFELEGDGCRALEKRGGDKFPDYWREIFLQLKFNQKLKHVSITRFDFAIDVFNATFKLDEIVEALENRNVLTPFLRFDSSVGIEFASYDPDLHIIYVGSKKSDFFLCIYDKKEERESIGKTIEFDSWYRFEFRIKHKKADNFIMNLLDKWNNDVLEISNFASELILKYVDIKDRPKQGVNSTPGIIASKQCMQKWKTNSKWLDFVGATKKADIVNYYKYESSITKNANWVNRSVSKTLAKLFLSNSEYFFVFLKKCVLEGFTRCKKSDYEYVNEFRSKHQMKKLEALEIDEICNKLNLDLEQTIQDMNIDIFFDENGELRGY